MDTKSESDMQEIVENDQFMDLYSSCGDTSVHILPYWKVRFSCATNFTPKISRQKQCAGAALETETPSCHAHEGRKIKYSMKINTSNASCFYSSLSRYAFSLQLSNELRTIQKSQSRDMMKVIANS